MPPILTASVQSMTSSNIVRMKKGCELAASLGFDGVRCDAGINTFGFTLTPSFQYITEGVEYACDAGLTKMVIVLGYGPRIHQVLADAYNGGALWTVRNRPPAGTANGLWNWLADVVWQGVIDAAIAACVAKSVDPATFLEFELFNEPGRGGVGGPFEGSSLGSATYPAPYDVLADGEIEADFWTYALYIANRCDFGTAKVISVNLEGQVGTASANEIASCTGADFVSLLALGDYIGTNCYSAVSVSSSATFKSNYSSKLGTQLTNMAANASIGVKPKVVGEFGIIKSRVLRCQRWNTQRNLLIDQVQTESLDRANFYSLLDAGTLVNPSDYAAYFLDGSGVATAYQSTAIAV